MRKWLVNTLIVGAIVLLFGLAMYFGSQRSEADGGGFVGTDSAATAMIEQSNPNYEPWASSLFTPGSSEIESGLFAMQAALGAGVLGFVLGALWQRNKSRTTSRTPDA